MFGTAIKVGLENTIGLGLPSWAVIDSINIIPTGIELASVTTTTDFVYLSATTVAAIHIVIVAECSY